MDVRKETMKNITITFTGDQATGKSRFMRALVQMLGSEGIEVVKETSSTSMNEPHQIVITSEDAFKFAESRGY